MINTHLTITNKESKNEPVRIFFFFVLHLKYVSFKVICYDTVHSSTVTRRKGN